MTRFNFWVDKNWIKKLKKMAPAHGERTVAGMIRRIIQDFINKEHEKQ